MPNKKVNDTKALSAFYSGALHNVETILGFDHAIENKINALLAASFVVLIFVAEKATYFDTQLTIGVVLLGLSIFIALVSIRIKTYYTGAVSLEKNFDYTKKTDKDFLLQIISDAETAFNKIEKKTKMKGLAYTFVLIFFSSGMAFSLISLIIWR